jgi:hypothetical protein
MKTNRLQVFIRVYGHEAGHSWETGRFFLWELVYASSILSTSWVGEFFNLDGWTGTVKTQGYLKALSKPLASNCDANSVLTGSEVTVGHHSCWNFSFSMGCGWCRSASPCRVSSHSVNVTGPGCGF